MDNRITEFLSKNHICSFSTVLPDSSIHAAALHYSHSDNPLELYLSTDNTSRKCQGLLNGETQKAAVVIGLSEEEWITLQLDGEVQIVSDKGEVEAIQKIHYTKNPGSEKFKDDPATVFLKFTPKWWRYTDFNTDPVLVIYSN